MSLLAALATGGRHSDGNNDYATAHLRDAVGGRAHTDVGR